MNNKAVQIFLFLTAFLILSVVAFDVDSYGRAEAIVQLTEENEFLVKKGTILSLKKQIETLKDYKVAVYSTAGSSNLGKSFFMNYSLRFLYANYKSVKFMKNPLSNKENWIGKFEKNPKGFDTSFTKAESGLYIWSDIFIEEEKKIAILLIDTQGSAFTTDKRGKLLMLNSLLSSFMLFNVKEKIDFDQLQQFKFVTKYGEHIKNVNSEDNVYPLQQLLFIIRDRKNEAKYGISPGNDHYNSVKASSENNPQFSSIMNDISSSFSKSFAFFMPPFVVNREQIDGNYKSFLTFVISNLLKPEALAVKSIMGHELNFKDFCDHLEEYSKVFDTNVENIYNVTLTKHVTILTNKAFTDYEIKRQNIDKKVPNTADFEQKLRSKNDKIQNEIIQSFKENLKMGTKSEKSEYEKELEDKMKISFDSWLFQTLKNKREVESIKVNIPIPVSDEDDDDADRQRTFILIKPDAVQRGFMFEILKRFETRGLKLIAMKFMKAEKDLLEKHYQHLSSKEFFADLIKFMSSGPVVATVWKGVDAVQICRAMIGDTKPSNSAAGTIRGDFGIHAGRNVIHGSDSVENAKKEIKMWFKDDDFVEWKMDSEKWIYE